MQGNSFGETGDCQIAISPTEKAFVRRLGECIFTIETEREREVDGETQTYISTDTIKFNKSNQSSNSLTDDEIAAAKAKYITEIFTYDEEFICKQACNLEPTCTAFYF